MHHSMDDMQNQAGFSLILFESLTGLFSMFPYTSGLLNGIDQSTFSFPLNPQASPSQLTGSLSDIPGGNEK